MILNKLNIKLNILINILKLIIKVITIIVIYCIFYIFYDFIVPPILIILIAISLSFLLLSGILDSDKFLTHIGAMFPRLFMVIIAGWTLLVTTEELVSTSVFSHIADNFIYNILAVFVLIIFIMIEVKNLGLGGRNASLFWRSIGVLIIGIVYSLLVGVIAINMVIPGMLDKLSPLEKILDKYYSSPEMSQVDFQPVAYTITYNKDYWNYLQGPENHIMNTYYTCSTDKIHEYVNSVYPGNKVQIVRVDFLLKQLFVEETLTRDKIELLSYINIRSKFIFDIPYLNLQESHKWCYVKSFNSYKFIIIPGFLFNRLFFVLFAGICLQLIFEEKPMTEPL